MQIHMRFNICDIGRPGRKAAKSNAEKLTKMLRILVFSTMVIFRMVESKQERSGEYICRTYASIFFASRLEAISILPNDVFQLFLSSRGCDPTERPKQKHHFGINDTVGTRLLTRLRVHFSDLRLHKFDHRSNCDSPTCTCRRGFESVQHFSIFMPIKGECSSIAYQK